jgi:hypothetical protein
LLRPDAGRAVRTALTVTPRVYRHAQVVVLCNQHSSQYSVPARFIGHRLQDKLTAFTATVYEKKVCE